MLHRHDFVTPYIDGIRFFDKPPLMYWLASSSMFAFGEQDWAGRIPLALAVLALLVAVYALGLRLYRTISPAEAPDRGALYSALALATAIGPYLYTRFYIPDILIALWMTLSVHLFLIALDRIALDRLHLDSPQSPVMTSLSSPKKPVILSEGQSPQSKDPDKAKLSGSVQDIGTRQDPEGVRQPQPLTPLQPEPLPAPTTLIPCLLFAATLALNLLTKGLIGLVFPIAFVLIYLTLTRQLRVLPKLHPVPGTLVFAAIALPWHLLAALRNPAIPMPPGLGLPARAGWAWFYLYNEHIARFLAKRIPHDYGQTPVWLFWLYAALWIFPWTTFLAPAIAQTFRDLGHRYQVTIRNREAALTVTIWSLVVLVFFTLSSRQEYYSLPALPALALMAGGFLARADRVHSPSSNLEKNEAISTGAQRSGETPVLALAQDQLSSQGPTRTLVWHRFFLLPLSILALTICTFYALKAPVPAPGADLNQVLTQNTADYNVSLGHLFDLTGPAMGFFRVPLALTALGMLILGPMSYLLRARTRTYAANLTLAAGMTIVLLAAHGGLVAFNPILGSKGLAGAILSTQQQAPRQNDLILIDGELTAGSTLLFYTRQPVHLVEGRMNGPWFGAFWPDAPPIFETNASLHTLWASKRRCFLLTYNPKARTQDLSPYGAVKPLASAGGKTILTNH